MTLDDLAIRLRTDYPDATVRLDRFPSGSAMLDVLLLGTLFVVEHRPHEGYGLSVVEDDAQGFLHGHEFIDATLQPVADRLMESLDLFSRSLAPKPGEGRTTSRRMVV